MKFQIKFSQSAELLNTCVPRSYLPAEYGGLNSTVGELSHNLLSKLQKYRNYYNREQ